LYEFLSGKAVKSEHEVKETARESEAASRESGREGIYSLRIN